VSGVEYFWWFLNTYKRIEQLFGITRSMRGGNLNYDCLDLRDRLGDSALVQWIYAQYPQWDEASRRLNSSANRKNIISWKGDTKVAGVNVAVCLREGSDKAIGYLKESKRFSDDELYVDKILAAEPGVDMLHPYSRRRMVSVRAGD